MALLSAIRRWHLRDGIPIREIARRTGLSRNTIRKYLANGTLEPAYPKRHNASKLDPYAEPLASWLQRESSRGRKQRRNWRQLYGDLVALGYAGSYDRVAAFARTWEQTQQEAGRASRGTYVPLVFAPGEAHCLASAQLRSPRRLRGSRSSACGQHGHAVLFASAIDIVNTLAAAQASGRLKPDLNRYVRPRVLIIDELGYLPIDKSGADLLFQIVSQRYERESTVITTNRV